MSGHIDGEARGRTDSDHHRYAGAQGFLHELEARPAADDEDGLRQGQLALAYEVTDDLVDGVVPSDVLAQAEKLALGIEEAGGMDAASRIEQALQGAHLVR